VYAYILRLSIRYIGLTLTSLAVNLALGYIYADIEKAGKLNLIRNYIIIIAVTLKLKATSLIGFLKY
jgi:hypothetical protein